MTDEEWDKYVEKIARTVYVPQCRVNYTHTTFGGNMTLQEVPTIKKYQTKHYVKYETKEFTYKGKKYKRNFVKSYEEKKYEKKN
mgnify:CR=1 FL=1